MKERPILFSAPMVRALLAGTKTQTRRVVKPKLNECGNFLHAGNVALAHKHIGEWRQQDGHWYGLAGYTTLAHAGCAYGQPGDQLWVRETWGRDNQDGTISYRADIGSGGDADDFERNRFEGAPNYRWRPSIHMPRAASRILLEVVSVRVERLQEISAADAKAEGVIAWRAEWGIQGAPEMIERGIKAREEAIEAMNFRDIAPILYRLLWEQINGPGSWAANPWVWVVEFRRV